MIIALCVCRMNFSCGWQRSSCLFDDWMSYSCMCCVVYTYILYHVILWGLSQLFTNMYECVQWHVDVYRLVTRIYIPFCPLPSSSLFSSPPTHTHNTHTDNRPPNITGQLTVRVNVNVSLEEMYLAEDQDGDDIHTFILQVNIQYKCKLLSYDLYW